MDRTELKQSFIDYLLREHIFVEESPDILLSSAHEYDLLEEIEPDAEEILHKLLESPPVAAPAAPEPLEELLEKAKKSASLGTYLRKKAHQRGMVTYKAALFEQGQISRDYWSRLLNDDINPSKEKLLRVAILLRLSREEADDMLDKAGYALSPTILRDVIVGYCLDQHIYDFAAIEELLADHDIQSLFNDRRGA